MCLSHTLLLFITAVQIPEEANMTNSDVVSVCVGDEWYRYPSSFFLPGSSYWLQFVKSGFDGMLPIGFNASQVCASDFELLLLFCEGFLENFRKDWQSLDKRDDSILLLTLFG